MPPAALAAIACFAAHEIDPAAAAEGAYLARLAAAVLLVVAALAPPPAAELGLGAALATAAAWALPAGPGRGAAVMALLAASLTVAAARRLRHMLRAESGSGSAAAPNLDWGGDSAPYRAAARDFGRRNEVAGVRLAVAIAICIGVQALMRGELLFAPGRAARPWVALVLLPVAAGAAMALLWRRHGMLPALAAGGAAAVLAPGWTVTTTLAMLALAGGDSLTAAGGWPARRPASRGRPARSTGQAPPASPARAARAAPPAAESRRAGLWGRWREPALRLTGLVALALPVAWEPRVGWAAGLAGLALWRPWLAAGLALPLAAITRGLALPGALVAHGSWREGASGAAWLLMLVPAALLAAHRSRPRALLAAAALLAFATPWLPDRSALAAPLALAALALPESGAAAGIGALWTAAVLAGTALLASYPWLRQDPLGDALALLGAHPGPRLAAAVGGAALLLGGAVGLAIRRRAAAAPAAAVPGATAARAARIAAAAAGIALFAALAAPQLASPSLALLTAGDTVLLDRANPSWHTDLPPRRSRLLALQTSLIHGTGLAAGTPVARLRLLGTGASGTELLLRAGRDTGEWAARRSDVAAAGRARAPHPWLAWVAGDFFGQRYRARLRLPRAGSFARLQIDLAPGLPSDTGLALHQVELEP